VEEHANGSWCPGELRACTEQDDGTSSGEVQYRPPGEHSSYLDTFAREQLRDDTVDRSHGRGEA
jgi:hypothetical protein